MMMAEELLLYTSEGVFSIYPANICPPGIPVTFQDQAEGGAFLGRIITDKAVRHTLFLIFNTYVGKVPVNIPDGYIIKEMAEKLVGGELMLTRRLSSRPAGKDAIDRRPAKQPADQPESTPDKKTKQEKTARTLFIAAKPKKEIKRDYKIVIEVAGACLTDCCCDRLVSAAVGSGQDPVDPRRATPLTNARKDDHRHEVELDGITQHSRALFINPGCNEAADAACLIPLHARVKPVAKDARRGRWPTALVPIVPLAFTDADNSPEKAMALRNGWLYIYLDGHLWRELYACGDGTFRDVNLGLPEVAGADVREPSGHAVTTVLAPRTIEGETKTVQIAFAEVQWPWRQVCALGGPADDDPRFLPGVIAGARAVPVDQDRRDKRFYTLDLCAYPGPFQSADGRVLPIEEAPRPEEEKDPFARLRDKKIAAVISEDPLLVARRLAGEHQQAWRDMQELLDTLARAPEKNVKEKSYDPGRWFESAVLANQFFFAPFPDYDSWQNLHPAADQNAWQETKDQREQMQARLDKEAIDKALGVEQREKLRPSIDTTRQPLVDYLTARTKDELDLFVLMLDDYFILPRTAGRENTKGKNPFGYVDGWGVMEQLIARLGDHSQTLDADLFAEPPNTARLTRENPGAAFLNSLADPEQHHVLYTRLFPKAAGEPVIPDPSPADEHTPDFKPQHFTDKDQPGTEPVADFARHYARAAVAVDHPRVRHSVTRLINAVFDWQLAEEQLTFEELEQHGITYAAEPEEKQALFTSLIEGAPTGAQMAAFLRRTTLFFKEGAAQAADEAAQASKSKTTQVDFYSLQKIKPQKRNMLTADNVHEWDFDVKPGRSVRVDPPLPGSKNSYVVLPSGLETTLKVVNRKGKIIGGQPLGDFIRGFFGPRKGAKWLKNLSDKKLYRTRVLVTISKKPGILARLGRMFAEKKVMSRVIIPLAVMLETWNVSNSFTIMIKTKKKDEKLNVINDFIGAVFDFSALSAAIHFATIEQRAGIPWAKILETDNPWRSKIVASGFFRAPLGVIAGSYSTYLSGRDMMANWQQNDDATVANGFMFTGFALSLVYETAWACNFFSMAILEKGALVWAQGIIGGPLMWISLGIVVAGVGLLVFITKEDTPLEQWLANGPFSIRTFTPNLVPVYDETAMAGDLIIDENGCLEGVVPSGQNNLVQQDGAVFQIDANGKPVKRIGEIGRPVQAPGPLKDCTGRFAHHRPGDTDFGPPPGGSSTLKNYHGTGKIMEFWKEPEGSHLWITRDGILHDCFITVERSCLKPEEPVQSSRLSRQGNSVYITTAQGIVSLGRIGAPIQNRDKLLVDRQDKPEKANNKFRNWCEKPASAYYALAAALFTPRVQTVFSAVAKPGVKYPDANPFTGYKYLANIHISLPHFFPGRSRLLVQLWQTGVERVAKLVYDQNIAVRIDEDARLRQKSITWPLKEGDDRKLEVTTRVKLDLFGDHRLCLPLDPETGVQDWLTETHKVDKIEVRYDQDPLAVLMEVGM